MPNKKRTPCLVCGCVKPNAKRLCYACQSFHERNINMADQFICKRGNNNCLNESKNSVVAVSNGSVWRFVCKKCRLLKCFQVLAQPNEQEGAMMDVYPVDQECSKMEQDLSAVVQTFSRAHENFKNEVDYRQRPMDYNGRDYAIVFFSRYFDETAIPIAWYFKNLPMAKSLGVDERIPIFGNCFWKLFASWTAYIQVQPANFLLKPSIQPLICKALPNLLSVKPSAEEVFSVVNSWSPSYAEMAIFSAMLPFYDNSLKGKSICIFSTFTSFQFIYVRPTQGSEIDHHCSAIRQDLEKLARIFLLQNCGFDETKAKESYRKMLGMCIYMAYVGKCRSELFKGLIEDNPTFISSSRFMASISGLNNDRV